MNTTKSEPSAWAMTFYIHDRLRLFIDKEIKERTQFPSLVFEEKSWNAIVSAYLWHFLLHLSQCCTVTDQEKSPFLYSKDYLKILHQVNPRKDEASELNREALLALFPQFKTNPDYVVTSENIKDIKESLERDTDLMQRYEMEDRSRCMFQRDIHSVPEFLKRMDILERNTTAVSTLLNIVKMLLYYNVPPTLQTILARMI